MVIEEYPKEIIMDKDTIIVLIGLFIIGMIGTSYKAGVSFWDFNPLIVIFVLIVVIGFYHSELRDNDD